VLPTTAAVLEILIVGVEALAWVALLVLALTPSTFHIGALAASESLTVAVFGLFAYALGVVADRVADTAYKAVRDREPIDQVLVKARIAKPPASRLLPPNSIMRLRAMSLEDGRAKFLEYQRSRIRIARATAFNLAVALIAVPWYLRARHVVGVSAVIGIEMVVLLLFFLSILGTERITDAYHARLADVYRMWESAAEDEAARERAVFGMQIAKRCRRYAAVVYQPIDGGRFEFLLVRTTGKKYWTFPKGHRERVPVEGKRKKDRAEEGWEVALRETEEEAGVTGAVDHTPLTTYRYPSDDKRCAEIGVQAYLLRRTGDVERSPEEADRKVRWAGPVKAKALLWEGRTEAFATSQAEVVDAALKRLSRPQTADIDP
jgi:8-oxo-dGTP pyrophosphatase MutT (NUDIX family)